MAKADSTIRVNVIGDAKGLSKELGRAEKDVKGFGKSALGSLKGLAVGLGALGAASVAIDFGQTALAEADRLGDATTRLELQLGDLSKSLIDTSEDFAKFGQSKQDVLELEAAFADAGTAAGLSDAKIAHFAGQATATAAALALLGDADAATNMDLITKAAAGSAKAMKALGINVSESAVAQHALTVTGKKSEDQLTKSDKAAARYALVLAALKPKLDAVATGSGDVEQKQAELQARFETLTGKIGQGIEGPLNDFLGWLLAAVDGLEAFGGGLDSTKGNVEGLLGPVRDLQHATADLVNTLLRLIGMQFQLPKIGGNLPTGFNPSHPGVSNNTPPSFDREVTNAVNDYLEKHGRVL